VSLALNKIMTKKLTSFSVEKNVRTISSWWNL